MNPSTPTRTELNNSNTTDATTASPAHIFFREHFNSLRTIPHSVRTYSLNTNNRRRAGRPSTINRALEYDNVFVENETLLGEDNNESMLV